VVKQYRNKQGNTNLEKEGYTDHPELSKPHRND
ncbi:hypothetical protein Q604_UNBC17294G0001, partial [human gut metagenome]